jgi:hypothetical protein
MKNWLWAIALVAVGVALVFYFNYSPPHPTNSPESATGARFGASNQLSIGSRPSSLVPDAVQSGSPSASSLEPRLSSGGPTLLIAPPNSGSTSEVSSTTATNLAPNTVMENMRSAIRDYGSRFGGNPVGNNLEITRALNGENPKEVKFLRPDSGLQINSKGELVDSWGTPFFFHQLSGTETEIRSAGPDKTMWTSDDLVTK